MLNDMKLKYTAMPKAEIRMSLNNMTTNSKKKKLQGHNSVYVDAYQGSHFSATTKFQDFSRNLTPFSRYIFALAANLQLQF